MRLLPIATGILYLAGGALILEVTLSLASGGHLAAQRALGGVALAAGIVLVAGRRHMPKWAFHVAGLGGTALVAALVLLGGGGPDSEAYALLFLFVLVDASFFYTWQWMATHLLLVCVVASLAMRHVGTPVAMIVALLVCGTVMGLVVSWLARAGETVEEDPLTGLYNRFGLERLLLGEVRRARRDESRLSVVILDLDRFQEAGEAGQQSGAEHLIRCAEAWRPMVPPGGSLARYSGDEFVLLLPEYAEGAAADLADRMRDAVPGVRVSAGVAAYEPEDSPSMVLSRADVALYDAKSWGRGVTAVYGDPDRAGRELVAAIERGEMVLHYQPVVRLEDEVLIGFEALVRWNHPERGLLGPLEFVPVAERTGAIHALGAWVMEETCRMIAGRSPDLPRSVAVNASPAELREPGYAARVAELIARHGVPAGELMIEVTESFYDGDDDRLTETLAALRALGVRVAIDDFGSGYSSLRWLERLPVDMVKLDGVFLGVVTPDAPRSPVIEAIVAICTALGLEVIAECVEDAHQADALRSMGVDLAQGYFYGRPAPLTRAQLSASRD